jgi:hypothetical protein
MSTPILVNGNPYRAYVVDKAGNIIKVRILELQRMTKRDDGSLAELAAKGQRLATRADLDPKPAAPAPAPKKAPAA